MQRNSNSFTDLIISIIIPSVILMKFSGAEDLGPQLALIVALAFPISLGVYELVRFRKPNYFAILGLVSVLLTGGIGLLKLDAQWLAIKEAAIPAILGIVVLLSAKLGVPLIKTLLFNKAVLDTDKIAQELEARNHTAAFEDQLIRATYLFGGTFFFSSVMNYLLTTWIVTSPPGSPAFNEELGQLALLSYPVIALPCMAMMIAIGYMLWRRLNQMTGLSFEEVMASSSKTES